MLITSEKKLRNKLRKAGKVARWRLKVIAEDKARPASRIRPSCISSYLSCPQVKLFALERSYRRLGQHRLVDLETRVRAMNMRLPSTEPVFVRTKVKSSGGVRHVLTFGPLNTARQLLIYDLLRALHHLPAWQYDRAGRGRDVCVREICRHAETGAAHYAYLDIADCFQSFERDGMARVLSLPEEIIRNDIAPEYLTSDAKGHYRVDLSHTSSQPMRLSGLPQGSVCSNFVSSLLLCDLTKMLPSQTTIFMYRDDIVVLADTGSARDEAVNALRDGLLNHPSGRMRLKTCVIGNLQKAPLTFLGYRIRMASGNARVELSEENEYKLMSRWWPPVLRDVEQADSSLTRSNQMLQSASNGFSLVDFRPIRDSLNDCGRELLREEDLVRGIPRINFFPGSGRR